VKKSENMFGLIASLAKSWRLHDFVKLQSLNFVKITVTHDIVSLTASPNMERGYRGTIWRGSINSR
jgi:hypothetical protein